MSPGGVQRTESPLFTAQATRRLAAVLAQSADLVTAKLDPLSRNTASARLHVTDCSGPSARRPRAG
jgi:hypothetical protein